MVNPFPNNISDYSKLNEFVDDNFKFNKMCWKIIQTARKHCGRRRNFSIRAISPFPTVFSKDLYSRYVKTRACLGKGEYDGECYFYHLSECLRIYSSFKKSSIQSFRSFDYSLAYKIMSGLKSTIRYIAEIILKAAYNDVQ